MRPERWRQIEDLYHAALKLQPARRAAFLAEACASDLELHAEVESLLGCDDSATHFIERAALDVAARTMAEDRKSQVVGQQIGGYRLISQLGAGGMGEVYLAEDTRLGRKVAMKFLPQDLGADEAARRRFAQEARAASALNHPHIITIYDIGSMNGRDFIAMEYVDGETVRSALVRGRMEVKRALELAAEAASGLAAAHAAGIVHRDIKPENLIIARPGQIKILDFGLAKLVEKQRPLFSATEITTAAERQTIAEAETKPGTVMGTVAYMSPEQAGGAALDNRTDIFSLGVVLYELVTGQRPFRGSSAIETLHAIINTEPRPPVELNHRLPVEVEEILSKALAKDPRARYQHAGDLELDLRRLKRAIESSSTLSARAQSAVSQQPSRKTKQTAAMWLALGALVILGVAAGWIFGCLTVKTTRAVPLANATLTPLTTDPGYEGEPTFSPDGQTIAYVSDRTGNFEIFIKQVSGGPEINITNNPADDVQPSLSPDGKQIAFVSSRAGSSDIHYASIDSPMMGGDVWVMTALGGNVRRIAESGNFPSWSPDGSAIIFASGPWFNHKIYRIASNGGEPQEIPINFKSDEAASPRLMYPSYSSDGRWIVFWTRTSIYVVSAEGGEPKWIAKGIHPVWNAGSSAILYSSAETGKNFSLWQVPFSIVDGKVSGSPEALTISRGRDVEPTVSRDGKLIAFTAQDLSFNVEVMAFDAETGRSTGQPHPLTRGSEATFFLNASPDSRSVVFESRRGSSSHIWRVDGDSVPAQLTSDPSFDDGYPRWSPDGHTIIFSRKPTDAPQGKSTTWSMTEDGANPQLLIEGASNSAWMPGGRALVYLSAVDLQLYLFDREAKTSRRLTDEPRIMPIFIASPDGKWVVYQSTMAGNVDLRAISIEGGPSRVVVDTPHQDYHPSMSSSGNWLYFQPSHKNLYRVPGPAQDWRKAEPQRVTNFAESGLFLEDIQTSRNGRQLLYSHGHITGDIWIMNLGK